MAIAQEIMTAQQLFELPDLGPCELVRGRLVRLSYMSWREGPVASRLLMRLSSFAKDQALGVAVGRPTGFQIGHDPDTVRAPDVAFVRPDQVPHSREVGYFQGPPDLAVEVVSPNDRAGELLAKVQDWLGAGCRAVWVVDPNSRTISIHRSSRETALLTMDDELTDDDVLPGFCLPVAEVF